MCRLLNIAMRDNQGSVTTRQTPDKSDPNVPLCFAGNTKTYLRHSKMSDFDVKFSVTICLQICQSIKWPPFNKKQPAVKWADQSDKLYYNFLVLIVI